MRTVGALLHLSRVPLVRTPTILNTAHGMDTVSLQAPIQVPFAQATVFRWPALFSEPPLAYRLPGSRVETLEAPSVAATTMNFDCPGTTTKTCQPIGDPRESHTPIGDQPLERARYPLQAAAADDEDRLGEAVNSLYSFARDGTLTPNAREMATKALEVIHRTDLSSAGVTSDFVRFKVLSSLSMFARTIRGPIGANALDLLAALGLAYGDMAVVKQTIRYIGIIARRGPQPTSDKARTLLLSRVLSDPRPQVLIKGIEQFLWIPHIRENEIDVLDTLRQNHADEEVCSSVTRTLRRMRKIHGSGI